MKIRYLAPARFRIVTPEQLAERGITDPVGIDIDTDVTRVVDAQTDTAELLLTAEPSEWELVEEGPAAPEKAPAAKTTKQQVSTK